MKKRNDWNFWKGTFKRAFVLLGFTFFSIMITGVSHNTVQVLEGAGLTAGLYFFAELIRYYKIQMPEINTKTNFQHLIFP